MFTNKNESKKLDNDELIKKFIDVCYFPKLKFIRSLFDNIYVYSHHLNQSLRSMVNYHQILFNYVDLLQIKKTV